MKAIGIIPARYASTRFPGKPLAMLGNKTMIQRVYEQCQKAQFLDQVFVATDDERIEACVQSFGGNVIMTSPHHPSGTDRIAEAAAKLDQGDIIINIQGDEPLIAPALINALIVPIKEKKAEIATAAIRLEETVDIFNPNVVKVVFNQQQEALYFSRNPIPFQRGIPRENWLKTGSFFQHIGIYAFQKASLLELTQAHPSAIEKQESLEQLRWLDLGKKIFVEVTTHKSIGVDTPEDLEKIQSLFE